MQEIGGRGGKTCEQNTEVQKVGGAFRWQWEWDTRVRESGREGGLGKRVANHGAFFKNASQHHGQGLTLPIGVFWHPTDMGMN